MCVCAWLYMCEREEREEREREKPAVVKWGEGE